MNELNKILEQNKAKWARLKAQETALKKEYGPLIGAILYRQILEREFPTEK